ncbi:hypothetical protein [Sphingomonas bacterium]|uniref:hypothetical protein n=1 Tax=Sphingomonas bacterium TaxID=1895847 RepID=UPI002607ACCA|nr:hypothetical protein [Sphingomonas bacterium]MDB5678922.1 hypothetical protein [Sphingomonas bacterium]
MATSRTAVPAPASTSWLAPNLLERAIAIGFMLVFAGMLYAMARGWATGGLAEAGRAPPIVWLHLAVVSIVVGLTPVLLLRRRGDRLHRILGWTWCIAMYASALISLGIRHIGHGRLSGVHVLSFIYILLIPLLMFAARSHRLRTHRGVVVTALVILLLAGAATFLPPRYLGTWMLE